MSAIHKKKKKLSEVSVLPFKAPAIITATIQNDEVVIWFNNSDSQTESTYAIVETGQNLEESFPEYISFELVQTFILHRGEYILHLIKLKQLKELKETLWKKTTQQINSFSGLCSTNLVFIFSARIAPSGKQED
jgi:hypothetical protein